MDDGVWEGGRPPATRTKKSFGARMRPGGPPRDAHARGGRLQSQTEQFERVAAGGGSLHRPGRRGDWAAGGRDFDFSEGRPAAGGDRQRPANGSGNGNGNRSGTPKYASGQRVGIPGTSLLVAEEHLKRNFIPPKTQDSFLGSIVATSAAVKSAAGKRPGAKRVLVASERPASSSSLEAASAPSPPVPPRPLPSRADTPLGSSGWTNTRKASGRPARQAQPRVSLSGSPPTQRQRQQQQQQEQQQDATPRRSSHHFAGGLASRRLSEHGPKNRQVRFALGSKSGQGGAGMATRSRTKAPVIGASADQPIALDDSDSDVEVAPPAPAATLSHSQEADADQVSDASTLDLNELGATCIARVDECDVLFGLFQCTASLMFQNDRVCISGIRGNHETWPFQQLYVLKFNNLIDARVCWEADNDDGKEDSPSFIPAGDELPFIALRCPPPESVKEAAWRSFFDPTDSCDAISKKYIIFKPTDSTNAKDSVDTIVEIVRSFNTVEPIEKSERRRYLCALEGEPFSFAKATRPKANRKRKKPGADGAVDSDDDSEGDEIVLTYPPPPCASDIVTLIRRDVNRLKPERYLNDNLIDYYFKRLMLDTFRDEPAIQQRVLFLSSHFYSHFRMGRGANVASRLEAGYKNVSKWLARADFFNRSMIFIPINKDWHWSLAIILNPRCAAMKAREDVGEDPCSCIAVLDPLGSYHNRKIIVRNLRMFLRLEWQNSQRGANEDASEAPPYDIDRVRAVGVNTPRQDNGYDCGVYVLKFAEVILRNCLALRLFEQPDGAAGRQVVDGDLAALLPRDAFAQEDVDAARRHVRSCIDSDARQASEKRPLE